MAVVVVGSGAFDASLFDKNENPLPVVAYGAVTAGFCCTRKSNPLPIQSTGSVLVLVLVLVVVVVVAGACAAAFKNENPLCSTGAVSSLWSFTERPPNIVLPS